MRILCGITRNQWPNVVLNFAKSQSYNYLTSLWTRLNNSGPRLFKQEYMSLFFRLISRSGSNNLNVRNIQLHKLFVFRQKSFNICLKIAINELTKAKVSCWSFYHYMWPILYGIAGWRINENLMKMTHQSQFCQYHVSG